METPIYLHLRPFPPTASPLRVAVVTETYPPEINGVALTIRHMIAGLRQRNIQIQLIRPRQGLNDVPSVEPNLEQFLVRGVPIPRYPNLQMSLPAGSALKRIWSMNRPDLVHLVTEGPLGWSALAVARKLKIPVTSDFHTNFDSYTKHYGAGWLRKPMSAYLRHFHNRTLLTLVPSGGLHRDLVAQGYRNLSVLGRGVDTDLFSPARRNPELRHSWGVSMHDLVVVYVGRLAPEKNLDAVIAAFNAMRSRHPRAKMVWVGDGPQRKTLQEQNPGHIFAGMRTGVDLAKHFASSDVFLFPSLTETFGNVTLEAMASGLAVVAYDYAAAAEHIRHGENGLIAEYGNISGLCKQAAILAAQPNMIPHLGNRARKSAEDLSWPMICERFEQLLRNVVNEDERHGKQNRFMSVANSSVGSGALPPL